MNTDYVFPATELGTCSGCGAGLARKSLFPLSDVVRHRADDCIRMLGKTVAYLINRNPSATLGMKSIADIPLEDWIKSRKEPQPPNQIEILCGNCRACHMFIPMKHFEQTSTPKRCVACGHDGPWILRRVA